MKAGTLIVAFALIFGSAESFAEDAELDNQHTVFVFSDPPLSEIYVNGVKQESPTPAVIRVPANATPEITITHQGHQPFKKKINTKGSGSELSAHLKPLAKDQ